MDNLDEAQRIHPSKNCIHIYNHTATIVLVHLMTYISACAAFMLHTVCLTSHCYRDQALLRLSVAVVVLWCVLPCVCVFHCCCCLMVLWSVHMAVVRSWCEGAGGPASGFKFLLGRFVPVYCALAP